MRHRNSIINTLKQFDQIQDGAESLEYNISALLYMFAEKYEKTNKKYKDKEKPYLEMLSRLKEDVIDLIKLVHTFRFTTSELDALNTSIWEISELRTKENDNLLKAIEKVILNRATTPQADTERLEKVAMAKVLNECIKEPYFEDLKAKFKKR